MNRQDSDVRKPRTEPKSAKVLMTNSQVFDSI